MGFFSGKKHKSHADEPHGTYIHEPLDVLMVEDVSSDALLAQLALDATDIPYDLSRIDRGKRVYPYLLNRSKLPDLMLLDLGLPDVDGFEVLSELAEAPPRIRSIPIVILTGYKNFDYIRNTYSLPILAYIAKPCSSDDIQDVLIHICRERMAAG